MRDRARESGRGGERERERERERAREIESEREPEGESTRVRKREHATETRHTGIVDEDVATAHGLAGFQEECRNILLLADIACVHVQPAAVPRAAL